MQDEVVHPAFFIFSAFYINLYKILCKNRKNFYIFIDENRISLYNKL